MQAGEKMELVDSLLRLSVAFLLGSTLGIERQWRQRMAGLRTNTLVSTGAALFVLVSVYTTNDSSPTRIPAQIVSGIGFLAGGVILKEGLTVKGLKYGGDPVVFGGGGYSLWKGSIFRGFSWGYDDFNC